MNKQKKHLSNYKGIIKYFVKAGGKLIALVIFLKFFSEGTACIFLHKFPHESRQERIDKFT